MKKPIYLDNAATTAARPEVIEAMLPYFGELYGNPSTVYSLGASSKQAEENARGIIAGTLGTDPKNIYFTAGGSESDNWAIKATAEAYAAKGKHIITSKIEHHAVLHTCEYLEKQGYEVTYLDVDENGTIRLEELEAAKVAKAAAEDKGEGVCFNVYCYNNQPGVIIDYATGESKLAN